MANATTSATLLNATKQADLKGLSIPLIDVTPLVSSNASQQDREHTGREILKAFTESGFLYLSALPIPVPTLTSVFANSAAFFALPEEQKHQLRWYSARANRGWSGMGREKVSVGTTQSEVDQERQSQPDRKESFEIGRDDEPDCPNMWPEGNGEESKIFRTVMTDFFDRCKDLHRLVMRAIALGMGYEETYFDEFCAIGDNTLRLLHYPPVPAAEFRKNAGAVRAGAHTDYGSITFLFQDNRGGLQVQRESDGSWADVQPVEGTVIVNAGDLLSRWSNGRIRSTMHRVVNPPAGSPIQSSNNSGPPDGDNAVYPARYSIAYFCNPDFAKTIEALPGTWETEGKKWPAVTSGDYIVQRLEATY